VKDALLERNGELGRLTHADPAPRPARHAGSVLRFAAVPKICPRQARTKTKLHTSATSALSGSLLLVDDDDYVLSALGRGLRGEGHKIFTAPSAARALEILATAQVAVIISDHRMPGMSGIEFLRQVASTRPDIFRIMLSGDSDPAMVAVALGDGTIHKFLSKPWDLESLRGEIRRAFMRHTGTQASE
jgi:response regulator RpfG family c-di-GMP phosphodiesterase